MRFARIDRFSFLAQAPSGARVSASSTNGARFTRARACFAFAALLENCVTRTRKTALTTVNERSAKISSSFPAK
jgi:hypothetical protein